MFIKHPVVADISNQEYIDTALAYRQDLSSASYSVQEKLDGIPIRLMFTKDGKLKISGKNGPPKKDSEGRSIKQILKEGKYAALVKNLKKECLRQGKEINLFGTLVGPELSQVNYGTRNKLRFFDMQVDNEWSSPKDMVVFFYARGLPQLTSPRLLTVRTLENVKKLDRPTKFKTELFAQEEDVEFPPEDDSIIAGVIIKPMGAVILIDGVPFMLKMENDRPKKEVDKPTKPKQKEKPKKDGNKGNRKSSRK